MLSLYLLQVSRARDECPENSPHEVNGFDNEAQRGAHGCDILVHDALDDGRLAGIVETPAMISISA